jgi:hypothetical protein
MNRPWAERGGGGGGAIYLQSARIDNLKRREKRRDSICLQLGDQIWTTVLYS